MGSLLVVSGPPGAGKSTVSSILAGRFERSILITGDTFFDFLAAGSIEPWLPEADEQNRVVAGAGARATARFVEDYDVIYDGVLGPWHLALFMSEGSFDTLDYAVILPTVEVCLDRIATRRNHLFVDADAARRMHDEFVSADIDKRHVIEMVTGSGADVADAITDRRAGSALRVER